MSHQQPLRRSKRLQQLRQNNANTTTVTRKRRSRKQLSMHEPPKKRQRRNPSNSVGVSTMPASNFFPHHLDQKKYSQIYVSLQSQQEALDVQLPDVIMKEISEFANGSFRKCYNYRHCRQTLHVLHEHSSQSDIALEDEESINESHFIAYLKERAFLVCESTEYFTYLRNYYCADCSTLFEECSVCNELCVNNGKSCRCGHELIYCNKCETHCTRCKLPMCHKLDERRSSELDECGGFTRCTHCRKR
mmetsp:Transcript_55468/g.88453  ORF Transcript_55468/g.88453 Transcript_55468/m.88453 type:complete len:247 (-) Transcript_55468:140-880(-)